MESSDREKKIPRWKSWNSASLSFFPLVLTKIYHDVSRVLSRIMSRVTCERNEWRSAINAWQNEEGGKESKAEHIFAAREKEVVRNRASEAKSNITREPIFQIPCSAGDTRRNEISIRTYECLLATVACATLIGLPHHIFLLNTAILLSEENQYPTRTNKKCILTL